MTISSLPEPPSSQSIADYWCTHNKVLRERGGLSPEKIRRLEGIGWWTWQDGFGSRWRRRYEAISALNLVHGITRSCGCLVKEISPMNSLRGPMALSKRRRSREGFSS